MSMTENRVMIETIQSLNEEISQLKEGAIAANRRILFKATYMTTDGRGEPLERFAFVLSSSFEGAVNLIRTKVFYKIVTKIEIVNHLSTCIR